MGRKHERELGEFTTTDEKLLRICGRPWPADDGDVQVSNLWFRDQETRGLSEQVEWTDGHWRENSSFQQRTNLWSIQIKSACMQ